MIKKIRASLPYKNIVNRPARSIALVVLCAILTCAFFYGTMMVQSLNRGLASLRNRMGADIMVVPFEATTKSDIDLENIILLGNMGYFYMDTDTADKIAAREGVSVASTQYYLSTVSSGCCSVPVQIIGFDPETDFTVTPWIKKSYGRDLREMEVVVGHKLNAFVGDTLTFYGQNVTVAAKLEETGTDLDTAVYCNQLTIRRLTQASIDLRLNHERIADPERVVSCVLVNVREGYSVDEVCNDINIHVRGVKAFRTAGLMEGIASSLRGAARVIAIMAVAVWLVCLSVLVIAFSMSVRERKKEFALLRAIGASQKKVSRIILQESALISFFGALPGVGTGVLILFLFAGLVEEMLSLPFLLPPVWQILGMALLAVCAGVMCAVFAGVRTARKTAGAEAGESLREM